MSGSNEHYDRIFEILDGLKKTAEGEMLHGFIARGLRKFGSTQVESAFLAFADKLLERYLANPDADPPTRVRVNVIQRKLRIYFSDWPVDDPARFAPRAQATPSPPTPSPAPSAPPVTIEPLVAEPGDAVEDEENDRGESTLPMQIARQMADALARGRELDDLLRASLAALETRGDEGLEELKLQLQRGVDELLNEHREMELSLANTRQELRASNEDRQILAKHLNKVREHSLTDELTGLPNRTAFLKQLQAEIGRARRYGFSLAVALLDIDGLTAINAHFGKEAGDTILHTYATEIMSHFRGYDLVARYGGDEFAVLLPNTQREGAVQAVDKAQRRAAGIGIEINGQHVPLPSFSSVLTLYVHGEAPAALLKRADDALASAKQRGRAQSVLALPTGS